MCVCDGLNGGRAEEKRQVERLLQRSQREVEVAWMHRFRSGARKTCRKMGCGDGGQRKIKGVSSRFESQASE